MDPTGASGRSHVLLRKWLLLLLLLLLFLLLQVEGRSRRDERRNRGDRRRPRLASCIRVEAFKKKLKGNFCPYTVSKMVSCKIVNGTETYTGRVAIGPRVQLMTMQRPRFVTSFKEVQETEYGCCPGFHGNNCDISCFNCTQIYNLESRVRTLEAKLLRSPSASLPPLEAPVIQMGLPDTSHVMGHPLNGRRDRGRGQRGRGSGNRNRSRDRANRNGNNRRSSSSQRPGRGSDIDIEEEGGVDAYDVDNSVTLPRPTLTTAPSSSGQCSCPPGPPGPPGLPGRDGQRGTRGHDGIPGQPGAPGPAGPPGAVTQTSGRGDGSTTSYIPGPPGPPGLPGQSGLKGVPGDPGRPGNRGRAGRPGRDGQAGSEGPPGPPGPAGIGEPGAKGEEGIPGRPGAAGPVGPPGVPGIPGPTGQKGEAGLNGISGRPGEPGLKGEIGPVGIPGPRGDTGFPGPAGQRGLEGPRGPPGLPGPAIPIPGSLDHFGGDYPGTADGFEGSGYEILIDDDEYPLGIPGIVPRGRPGPPGPKGDKGDRGESGRAGIPGPKGELGFEGGLGAPGEPRPIQDLFENVGMLRAELNLLDARVRILETELPKIIGLAGEDNLLPGYPDAPYEPHSGTSASAGEIGAAADQLYKQVDRLNGLVTSALPSVGGGVIPSPHEIPSLPDSSLTYPVEVDSSQGLGPVDEDSYDYSDSLQPPVTVQPIIEGDSPPFFPHEDPDNSTSTSHAPDDYDYTYDYGSYEYENGDYEYDDYYEYEDEVRRKRQPVAHKVENDVSITSNNQGEQGPRKSDAEHLITSKNGKAKKLKKSKTQNKPFKSKKRYNNAAAHGTRYNNKHSSQINQSPTWRPFTLPKTTTTTTTSPTTGAPRQAIQNRVEKIRALKERTQRLRARRQKNSGSSDSIHPLRRSSPFSQRTKRDVGNPFKKSSVEDITWI